MAIHEIIQSIAEKAQSSANVKTVYGEPVVSGNKSVVPVAKIAYGFGGGGGARGRSAEEHEGKDEGGGGGGGCKVIPVGVVEITDTQTRYIPFNLAPKMAGGVLAGLLFGYLMGRRRRKHES